MQSMFRAVIGVVLLGSVALAGEMQTTLALSGLTCAACSAAVTKALKQVSGVREVEVGEDRRHAAVIADDSVRPQVLAEAVRQLGYGAEVMMP